jgi:5-methylcytosine-specific restriction endonuclease McrA
MLIYKGYVTKIVDEAVKMYKKKTGVDPTILVIRTNYEVIGDHPGLIRSDKFGIAGVILASHILTREDIDKIRNDESVIYARYNSGNDLSDADLEGRSPEVKQLSAGRPKEGGGKCPHCQQDIKNFNNIGWWWGWQQGIEPPYWEELRLFVFRRDGFHCQYCHKMFGMNGLVCHHIMPKEEGGIDGAHNILTLCHDCHKDDKPIMPDSE